ncbi:hypothetical protein FQR65_LT20840 [Abscondita terminalis]|nr:hypothetical protein FQR65_LT20840 [Abscondita terminalis]
MMLAAMLTPGRDGAVLAELPILAALTSGADGQSARCRGRRCWRHVPEALPGGARDRSTAGPGPAPEVSANVPVRRSIFCAEGMWVLRHEAEMPSRANCLDHGGGVGKIPGGLDPAIAAREDLAATGLADPDCRDVEPARGQGQIAARGERRARSSIAGGQLDASWPCDDEALAGADHQALDRSVEPEIAPNEAAWFEALELPTRSRLVARALTEASSVPMISAWGPLLSDWPVTKTAMGAAESAAICPTRHCLRLAASDDRPVSRRDHAGIGGGIGRRRWRQLAAALRQPLIDQTAPTVRPILGGAHGAAVAQAPRAEGDGNRSPRRCSGIGENPRKKARFGRGRGDIAPAGELSEPAAPDDSVKPPDPPGSFAGIATARSARAPGCGQPEVNRVPSSRPAFHDGGPLLKANRAVIAKRRGRTAAGLRCRCGGSCQRLSRPGRFPRSVALETADLPAIGGRAVSISRSSGRRAWRRHRCCRGCRPPIVDRCLAPEAWHGWTKAPAPGAGRDHRLRPGARRRRHSHRCRSSRVLPNQVALERTHDRSTPPLGRSAPFLAHSICRYLARTQPRLAAAPRRARLRRGLGEGAADSVRRSRPNTRPLLSKAPETSRSAWLPPETSGGTTPDRMPPAMTGARPPGAGRHCRPRLARRCVRGAFGQDLPRPLSHSQGNRRPRRHRSSPSPHCEVARIQRPPRRARRAALHSQESPDRPSRRWSWTMLPDRPVREIAARIDADLRRRDKAGALAKRDIPAGDGNIARRAQGRRSRARTARCPHGDDGCRCLESLAGDVAAFRATTLPIGGDMALDGEIAAKRRADRLFRQQDARGMASDRGPAATSASLAIDLKPRARWAMFRADPA